jgi:hypothetical protein
MHLSDAPTKKNRSSLVFAIGLLCAAAFAISLDGAGRLFLLSNASNLDPETVASVQPVGPSDVVERDIVAARVAWRYFAANTRMETGLVDSVAGFPSGTLWDQGSYLLALSSARALKIIDDPEFHSRTDQFLRTLSNLPLFEGKLPNKVYNTQTLQMTAYDNSVSDIGIGWSALDMGRLLSAMRILERRAPEYSDQIRSVLAGWDLNAMTFQGELTGAAIEGGEVVYPQEGRVGYEQYAARAAALWGLDVIRAISAARIVDWETVSGQQVPIDLRRSSAFKSITPTLSEPFFLQGLELGLDSETSQLAAQVYLAQEARFSRTGTQTMVSEDHVNQEPYFLYSSVHSNGEAWAVVTEDGTFHNDKRTLSLKAVFAWDALYGREYTRKLRVQLADLATEGGWVAGRYELSGDVNDALTLNTNAVVLEAIHYKKYGPLWQIR